ncbi:MAG TPA: hypothetical protein VFZ69_12010 [Longimicrobiales bacterium]
MNTVLEQCNIEVDEERHLEMHQPEISQDSCGVNGIQPFNGLELHDYRAFHDHIQPVAALQVDTLIRQRNGLLQFDIESAPGEFVREARLVRRLQEPRPELAMHMDGSANNATGNLIDIQLSALRASAVRIPFEVNLAVKLEDMPRRAVLMSR